MKTLFIYYSFTGNGELLATELQNRGADIRLIKPKKSLPKSFFLSMMVGGFKSGVKKKDKLVDFDSNLDGYDSIIIGGPIWNGRLCSPVNGALEQLDFANKKLTFLLYSGSGEAPKAIKRIAKEYPQAATIVLQEPKKYPENLKKLEELTL